MSNFEISCPHCGNSFELTEALAAPLLEAERKKVESEVDRRVQAERTAIAKEAGAKVAAEYGVKLKASQAALAEQEAKLRLAQEAELAVRQDREALEQAKREMELTVQRRVDAEKAKAVQEASAQTAHVFEAKLNAAEAAIAAKDAKLEAAHKAELEALKAKQEAEEAKHQAELTVARRMDEERAKVRNQAYQERDDEFRLKLGEKDKQLSDLRLQIEDLRRKGDSASQQLVGDVQELDLLDVLKSTFPGDDIQRIKKGQSGADIMHTVHDRLGQPCGKILWESKRTKTWSDGWLSKLRDDQRSANADVAALVSETLPETMQHFDAIEGVWVTGVQTVQPMAKVLRDGVIEIAKARRSAATAGTTKEMMFDYLIGNQFRQRVQGTIEPIIEMKAVLDTERRVMNKHWSAREKQLDRMMQSMSGMYGDLQGIAGRALPDIEGLVLDVGVEGSDKPKLVAVSSNAKGVSNLELGLGDGQE